MSAFGLSAALYVRANAMRGLISPAERGASLSSGEPRTIFLLESTPA